MNWKRPFRLQSFANLFSIFTFVLVGISFSNTYALTQADCGKLVRSSMTNEQIQQCDSLGSAGGGSCDQLKRRADDKKDEFFKVCKSSGQGIESCKSQQSSCENIGTEDEYSTSGELLAAFSTAMGVSQAEVSSKCPLYSGQGFYEEKDRLDDKLDDINKKLKENKKELADINKDFTADLKKIQEDIADAQKEYQEKQADIKKNQRDRAAEQAKQSAEMAQNMRKLESAVLQKQQEKDDIYADKSSSLGQMTEDVANSTCMDSVREAYLKRKEALKQTNQKGSSKSLISSGKTNNNFLNMTFKQCMAKFYNARLTLIRKSEAKIETTDKDIRNAQSDIDDMKAQLSQMATLEQQAKEDEQTQLTAQQTALQQKIQRANTEMQSLQQTTQQKAKAVTDDSAELQKKLTSVSNQIIGLGATPSGGRKSTASGTEVAVAAGEYADARDAANREDCGYYDSVFGSKGGSKSTGSNTKSGGSSSNSSGSR